jgi:superfamily II DNA or RNA helicase
MAKIIVRNDISGIVTQNNDLIKFLYDNLRFRDRNYFHNRAYRQRIWDGFTNFFNRSNGKFLTGLLPEIVVACKAFKEPVEIIDQRTKCEFAIQEINSTFLHSCTPPGANPITLEDYQVDLVNAAIKNKRGVIFAPTSAGKAQPLHSLVATPSGFVKMGNLKVGDLVCTPHGGSAPILAIHKQGKKKIVKVVFSNGDYVECCEDHLWKVNALYDQWNGKILTTKEISKRIKCPNGANRFNIETPKHVDFEEKSTLIDPYLMGILLGDGSFRRPNNISVTISRSDIVEFCRKTLDNNYHLIKRSGEKYHYEICGKQKIKKFNHIYHAEIRRLELNGKFSYEKHIPQEYLINSYDNRLNLLRGLMDSDGYISARGMLSYVTTSEQLSKDFVFLVNSLGGTCRLSKKRKWFTHKGVKKQGRLAYNIAFTMPEKVCPVRCEYKKDRYTKFRTRNKNRTISAVEYVGKMECQCIEIDHPDHLYVTDNFVVTHNSLTMLSVLKCLPSGTKTLVLQNRKTLAIQNYEEYTKWGLHNVGRIWGGVDEPNDITVSTVQSISKAEDLLPQVEVLLVDEIHDMMSAAPKAVYRMLKNCSVRIAVSATPFKFGETDKIQKYFVKGFFGPPFKIKSTESGVVTTKDLQERGRLSKSKCLFYKIKEPDLEYEIYQDAVTRGIVENGVLHQKVVSILTELKGRTLILVDRLAHGDVLQAMLPHALWVRGQDNDETRKQVIDQLQKKEECLAIATQGIFNTGINVFVHNLINAAGGQADHQIIQRMGRGLRTAKDKESLLYIDFLFENNPYLHKHSVKRIKILKKQGHDVELLD